MLCRWMATAVVVLSVTACGIGRGDVDLAPSDQEAAIRAVRAVLAAAPGETFSAALPPSLGRPFEREVFLSVFAPGGKTIVGGFRGKSLADSLLTAATRMRSDPSWTEGGFAGAPLAVQIDILSATGKLPIPSERVSPHFLTRGLDGVYMTVRDRAYFLLPWQLYVRPIDPSQATTLVGKGQGVLIELPRREPVRFYRFRTFAFAQTAEGAPVVPLYRSNYLLPEVNPQVLLEVCQRAGRNLVGMQRKDGRFHYEYFPVKDSYARTGKDEDSGAYNYLRHAGTTYSLFQLYTATGDDAFRNAAEAATRWMTARFRTSADGQRTYPVEGGTVKLGGAALALLALVERARATGQTDQDATMERLAAFIVSLQKADGSFDSYYSPSGKARQRKSIYYPGEAILALVRLHAYRPDARWLEAAAKGADYLVHRRWKLLGIDVTVPPDAWLMLALNDLHDHAPDPDRAAYCSQIGEAMIADQLGPDDTEFADYVGGYVPLPPSVTPAGSRMEGLTAGYRLRQKLGLDNDRWLAAIRSAARFQANCQIRPETAYLFPNPQRALGAFRDVGARATPHLARKGHLLPRLRFDYHEDELHMMRIDYNQHNVSGLLAAAKILAEADGAPTAGGR